MASMALPRPPVASRGFPGSLSEASGGPPGGFPAASGKAPGNTIIQTTLGFLLRLASLRVRTCMLPSLAFRVPPGASRMRLGGLPGPPGWFFGGLPMASRGFPGASGKPPGAKKRRRGDGRTGRNGVHLVRMVTIKRTNIPWQNWVRGVTGIWLFFIKPRTQFRTQPEKR